MATAARISENCAGESSAMPGTEIRCFLYRSNIRSYGTRLG